MPQTTRNRPGSATGAASKVMATTTPTIANLPRARAYVGPPAPGRRFWLVVVMSCPICRGMHSHRGVNPRIDIRRCPTTRQLYTFGPISRRREAVRRA